MGGRSFGSSSYTSSSEGSEGEVSLKSLSSFKARPKGWSTIRPFFNSRHKSDFTRRTAYRRKSRRIMRQIAFVYRTDAPFRTAAWGTAAFIGLKLFEWWIK
jgi:hypothetical protein